MKRSLTIAALSAALVASSAASAMAEDTKNTADHGASPATGCSVDGTSGPWYSVSGKSPVYIPDSSSRVYGTSNVTLTLTVGKSWSVSGSVTGTAGSDAGVIFAKASASLSVSLTGTRSGTLTQGGSWTVPSGRTGWFEIGTTNAYSFKWSKFKLDSKCNNVILASGTGKAPTKTANPMFTHS